MKIPFFKPLLVAGALMIAWNCSDEAAITVPTTPQGAEQFAAVTTPSWIFNGDQTYIITPTEAGFFVADKAGNPVGTYDPALGIVYDGALTPIATIPDLSQLPVLARLRTWQATPSSSPLTRSRVAKSSKTRIRSPRTR